MPSLNRMNSTLPSAVSQSGNSVRTSRSADTCESALLCDKGNLRNPGSALSFDPSLDIISDSIKSDWIDVEKSLCQLPHETEAAILSLVLCPYRCQEERSGRGVFVKKAQTSKISFDGLVTRPNAQEMSK